MWTDESPLAITAAGGPIKVRPGDMIILRANANDGDKLTLKCIPAGTDCTEVREEVVLDDPISCKWEASNGTIFQNFGREAAYWAPNEEGDVEISVECGDSQLQFRDAKKSKKFKITVKK